jgi:hypothetical protein
MKGIMKRLILALTLCAVALGSARAVTVYDPTVHASILIQTSQEIAKFVEMINNQVQQVRTLTDQLNEFKHYKELFGDPKAVALAALEPLTSELRKTELGQTLENLKGAANATEAMLYDAGGLFHSVGTTFKTPEGKVVSRLELPYRPVAAVQKTTDNFLSVSTDASARRVSLKEQIAVTTDQLKAAKTDADVQKLTGVLVGLSAALSGADHEVNQATASAVVQDIANRADERRQVEAKKEQQHAEFTEAVNKYAKTFRLLTEPVKFPTR